MKPWPILLGAMKFLALASVIVAGVLATIYLPRLATTAGAASSQIPAEFITIILTAVTVVLAALAIVLALAGFVGYVHIKNTAELAARTAAEAKAAEVAAGKVAVLVPRLVEEAVSQKMGRNAAAGDDIATAEKGGEDAGAH